MEVVPLCESGDLGGFACAYFVFTGGGSVGRGRFLTAIAEGGGISGANVTHSLKSALWDSDPRRFCGRLKLYRQPT